jgi:hypothetical protein
MYTARRTRTSQARAATYEGDEDREGSDSSPPPHVARATAATQSFLFAVGLETTASSSWILDSGASQHMCNSLQHFVDYKPMSQQQVQAHHVQIGDGRKLKATGVGKVRFTVQGSSLSGETRRHVITLLGVLYVPELSASLFSIGAAAQSGYLIQFSPQQCNIIDVDNGTVILQALRTSDGLYKLQVEQQAPWGSAADLSQVKAMLADHPQPLDPAELWHARLGHIAHSRIQQMVEHDVAIGISYGRKAGTDDGDHRQFPAERFCVACLHGRQHAEAISSSAIATRAKVPLELVHTDVCGPMRTATYRGHVYFVTFVDDHSRCSWVYLLRQKSDVFHAFKT